jgi:hypothetical protein
MSLIVCGSAQEQYGETTNEGRRVSGETGLERPNSFQNHLVSPLNIKANSEIAVQSVKINKNALFNIDESDVFYVYFGDDVANDKLVTDYSSLPIPIIISPGSYSAEALAREVKNILNLTYQHPELWGKWDVSVLANASFNVSGFEIIATQRGTASGENANLANLAGDKATEWTDWLPKDELYWDKRFNNVFNNRFQDREDVGSGGYSIGARADTDFTNYKGGTAYSASAISFTRTSENYAPFGGRSDWDCIGIMGNSNNVPPISCVEGELRVDFRDAPTGWRIGLTRPTAFVPNVGGHNTARVSDGGIDGIFWDYCVEFDGSRLWVTHACMDGDEDSQLEKERSWSCNHEVLYNNNVPITDSQMNSSTQGGVPSYNILKFVIKGQEIKLSLLDEAQANELMIVDTDVNATENYCFTPIHETTTALYPKFQLFEETEKLWITQYRAHNSLKTANFKYPIVTEYPTGAPGLYKIDPGSSFWGCSYWASDIAPFALPEWLNEWAKIEEALGDVTDFMPSRLIGLADDILRPVLSTKNQRMLSDFSAPQMVTTTATRSYTLLNSGNYGVAYKTVLILGRQIGGDYDVARGNYSHSSIIGTYPNMTLKLGSKGRPIITNTQSTSSQSGAGALIQTYESCSEPETMSNQAFVRLRNGLQTSYNANKGSVSKIVYALPRFDNSGRTYGNLFFECAEKTYIDFNNVTDMVLNDLVIDIVDIDERVVNDLVGQTVVVFHIREKNTN